MSGAPAASRWALICYGLLVLIATGTLWLMGGYSLDLLLCSTAIAGLMLPPFAVHVGQLPDRIGLAITCGLVVGGWWVAVHPRGEFRQVLPCVAVVVAMLWTEVGLCTLLARLGLNGTLGAAVVVSGTAVWLAWPLWTGTAAPLVVRLHPLLAINGVVADELGIWTEQPVAYPWIALGQDASYRLPNSIWPSAVAHVVLGVAAMGLSWGVDRMLGPRVRSNGIATR